MVARHSDLFTRQIRDRIRRVFWIELRHRMAILPTAYYCPLGWVSPSVEMATNWRGDTDSSWCPYGAGQLSKASLRAVVLAMYLRAHVFVVEPNMLLSNGIPTEVFVDMPACLLSQTLKQLLVFQ